VTSISFSFFWHFLNLFYVCVAGHRLSRPLNHLLHWQTSNIILLYASALFFFFFLQSFLAFVTIRSHINQSQQLVKTSKHHDHQKITTVMTSITPIQSALHLQTLTNVTQYVVVDFYADWCPPCKQIAPIYRYARTFLMHEHTLSCASQLASTHSSAGRIVFVKVDVDKQQEVARKYGITAWVSSTVLQVTSIANIYLKGITCCKPSNQSENHSMPTFLVLKKGSVVSTIQGANPPALRSAIEAAATEAAKSWGSWRSLYTQCHMNARSSWDLKDNIVTVKYTYISRNTDGGKYIAWETVLPRRRRSGQVRRNGAKSRDINPSYLEEQVPL